MSFATRMQNVAQRLLSTYGQEILFLREVESNYNPETASNMVEESLEFSGVGYTSDYSISEINGTTILAGDINLIVRVTTPPLVGDIVTIDNQTYRAEVVEKIKAQNIDIIYRIQLRQ